MKKELQDQLFALAPTLFKNREAQKSDPLQTHDSITRFGFECGDGWFDLLKTVIEGIEEHLKGIPEEVRGNYFVVQVKEKFGGLRFYMRSQDPSIAELVRVAEAQSEVTCELCGIAGKRRNNKGWFITLCDPHADPNFDVRGAMHRMF